jgi:hypothetical protein
LDHGIAPKPRHFVCTDEMAGMWLLDTANRSTVGRLIHPFAGRYDPASRVSFLKSRPSRLSCDLAG